MEPEAEDLLSSRLLCVRRPQRKELRGDQGGSGSLENRPLSRDMHIGLFTGRDVLYQGSGLAANGKALGEELAGLQGCHGAHQGSDTSLIK